MSNWGGKVGFIGGVTIEHIVAVIRWEFGIDSSLLRVLDCC